MYFVNKGKEHSIINDGNTTLKIVFASAPLDNICSEIQWKYPPTPAEGMTLLQNRAPEVYEEFRKLTQILNENSPIDRKTKELILLGILQQLVEREELRRILKLLVNMEQQKKKLLRPYYMLYLSRELQPLLKL